ncbi:DedA family protein [Paenibacillus sp. FSL H7-0331]|uniref:DedA family protein n=1 Tax=Paenibacillus sp. FSL H7-0331 TaxID=1920421 RepID=UPI00096C128B|nr:DedA family protein [Paenibacillus sp. FSL H7-0331]OMF16187.1 alkaline phosphatase [Paenibacillus sp. FSL H7-0331]
MTYEALITMIGQYGYAALFFALWLGIVGMPVPDEGIVMTGGAVTASGLLLPIPAFLLTYLGVVSGLTLGYVLGRWIGTPALNRMRRKKKLALYVDKSERLVARYGSYALAISYFLPVVRHIIPYLVGLNKMSFRRYALISYSTGFVWTLLFFTLGYVAGDHVPQLALLVHRYGLQLLWLPAIALIVYIIIRIWKKQRRLLTKGRLDS